MKDSVLTARLRADTRPLHTAAEQAGLMGALLRGRVTRDDYAELLRNLHALYDALETALRAHAGSKLVGPLALPGLARTDALRADLDRLGEPGWPSVPPTPAMREYVAHVVTLAREAPWRLGAHAYVRYLGDLNGGQSLRSIVRRALALNDATGLAFYDFGSVSVVAELTRQFRAALDALPLSAAQADAFVTEAQQAFERHIRVFEELGAKK